jgi:hypothetical protein
VFCGDYRTDINIKEVEDLKEGIVAPVPNHEYTEMGSMKNPKNVFATLQWLAGTFSIIGLIVTLLMKVKGAPISWDTSFIFVISFTFFVIFTIARTLAPDKNNVVFNRRTGMVSIPYAKKDIPFVELDAYYFCPQSTVGYKHTLYLGHRFSPFGFRSPSVWVDKQWLHGEWEYYQQYMDISLPLPDTPDFEPYRHLDPTTAAYDNDHNRPPNFWRDMPLEQVKKEQAEGTALTKNFAWHKLPAADHIPKECMDRLLPGARLFK